MGFPSGASGKEPTFQCRRCKRLRFDSWVRDGNVSCVGRQNLHQWITREAPVFLFLGPINHYLNTVCIQLMVELGSKFKALFFLHSLKWWERHCLEPSVLGKVVLQVLLKAGECGIQPVLLSFIFLKSSTVGYESRCGSFFPVIDYWYSLKCQEALVQGY